MFLQYGTDKRQHRLCPNLSTTFTSVHQSVRDWNIKHGRGQWCNYHYFLINCQSNRSTNDTNIVGCSIRYQRSHRCSFLLWPNLRPVLPSYYYHHHSDMKGEKQVLRHRQGETLILGHLHLSRSSTGWVNALPRCPLIGWHWKAGILLMLKASTTPPPPPSLSHAVTLSWWH